MAMRKTHEGVVQLGKIGVTRHGVSRKIERQVKTCDGVEFRAVRDLGHLSEAELKGMLKGRNPVDTSGVRLDGHHFQQQYHREPGAFMVEIPDPNHCISNPIQHPLGRSGGLTAEQRADWNRLRAAFNKERAKTELLRRTSNE